MRSAKPARLLRVHFAESDRYRGRPLYEALVDRCRELGIAGITVFRGLEGFGETAGLRRSGMLRHDPPMVAAIVDSAENVARAAAEIEGMLEHGLMAVSQVEAIRLEQAPGTWGQE
ncbi:MAG TPA: DUF190 domain-containing protein [Bryobacteraceae bacterium]|jgi:PII-like signaling protein|nr:DUF190 domain-containing protein [Bryobacteraceae bacterium]